MAREAGLLTWLKPPEDVIERFKAFDALVRADEREETNRRANASWTLMCEKMVAAEREACAKVCDAADKSTHPADLADAIRNRGNT
jgi:hypothetical protein